MTKPKKGDLREPPKKDLHDLLFDAKFLDGASKAIELAVARADAAGLPPAYEPARTKLQEFRIAQKSSREELLELRRCARAEKAENDKATLEFHRKVFDLLNEGGQPAKFLLFKAREMIALWEAKGLNSMYGPLWKQLLDGSLAAARKLVLSESKTGWPLGLRSCSPFSHIASYPADEWPDGKNLLIT